MNLRLAAVAVCVLGAAVAAQRGPLRPAPPAQTPTFRSTVDMVHLDVSVLDRDRRPVRGLGPADFTVIENGVPQSVVAFSAVDIPDDVATVPWMREIAPDVASNDSLQERRLFLIIIDDATIEASPYALQNVRTILNKIIDRFGPSDLASVVFTLDNRRSQEFTGDRRQLLQAAGAFKIGFRGMGGPNDLWFRYSVGVVESAVKVLATIPDRRKAIIYVGQGTPINLEAATTIGGNEGIMPALIRRMSNAFREAERANVNIYTIDACGLRVEPPPPPPPPTCVPGREVDYLKTLAGATGGRAVINTGDFDPGVAAIFDENASYYLLGYQSTDARADGKFRRLDVRVNRPNVTVRTRSGYLADKPDAAKRRAELAASPLGAALSRIVPKSDLPLRLQAVPFAIPGKKESAVAIIMGVRQPIRETGTRTVERVDLEVRAFGIEGKFQTATAMRADVAVRPGATGLAEYEVLTRIDLKPGHYQLRIAANLGSLSTSGSLYYDLDVPDFASLPFSLSGLVLSAAPALPVAPRDHLRSVLPVVPTTQRTFNRGDAVVAFLRAYLGGKAALTPATLRITLRNDRDELVENREHRLSAADFAADRSANISIDLGVARWPPGEYLLMIEGPPGRGPVRRDARFVIR